MSLPVDLEQIPVRLYNTASRQKEPLVPLIERQIKMYTCGPTIYNFAHIGNFRTYIFEDLLNRTLQFFGYKVNQVMNLTDVDDKTIRGAIAKGITLNQFTQPYKEAFFEDLKALNIVPADSYPAATDYIDEMIAMVQTLLDKEVAYVGGDGSIYYAIQRFPQYGCLSHLQLDELKVGASERVDHDEYDKDHAADFVLWKKYDPTRDGNIYWDSPFGPGRPGWHLECSAMAMKILGDTIDIHAGGIDNMFPHHENEIAQSEACSGKKFARLWMHAEHLIVDGKKMSKSLGNVYTLRELLERGFTGPQVRYMLLQTHYKTQLNFTFQGLEGVKNALQRLNDFVQRLSEVDQEILHEQAEPLIKKCLTQFAQALADDLNISAALGALFDFVREINVLHDRGELGRLGAQHALELMKTCDSVLGVLSFQKGEEVPEDLQVALEKRIKARQDKDWKLADELRVLIYDRGYMIEDTPHGARLKKN